MKAMNRISHNTRPYRQTLKTPKFAFSWVNTAKNRCERFAKAFRRFAKAMKSASKPQTGIREEAIG